ncbi:hypothetical protein [Yinghuangia sp. YIM S09857]|uniref:hypothetical protein n=1 Tax=Yinghuangia sp. YIM S09857 TaxID=3436929 RepID=UPI003F5331BF
MARELAEELRLLGLAELTHLQGDARMTGANFVQLGKVKADTGIRFVDLRALSLCVEIAALTCVDEHEVSESLR